MELCANTSSAMGVNKMILPLLECCHWHWIITPNSTTPLVPSLSSNYQTPPFRLSFSNKGHWIEENSFNCPSPSHRGTRTQLESLWKLLSKQQQQRPTSQTSLPRLIKCCRLRGIKIIVIENMTRCGGKECVMSCHCKGTPTFFIVCRSYVGFLSFPSFLLGPW